MGYKSPKNTAKTSKQKADHKAAVKAMLTGEVFGATNVGQLEAKKDTSPYAFIEWQNVLNLGDRRGEDRKTWRVVQPGIYAHHLFVAELGGDFLT